MPAGPAARRATNYLWPHIACLFFGQSLFLVTVTWAKKVIRENPTPPSPMRAALLLQLLLPAAAQPFCDPILSPRFEWQNVSGWGQTTGAGDSTIDLDGVRENPTNRFRAQLAHFKGRLLLLGGLSTAKATGPNDYENAAAWNTDVWATPDAGASWTRLATTAFPPRLHFRLVNSPLAAPTQQLFLAGGVLSMSPIAPTNQVYFTNDGARWARADWSLPVATYNFALTLSPSDDRLYVAYVDVMGSGATKVASVAWAERAKAQKWATTAALSGLGPRWGALLFGSALTESAVVMYGGAADAGGDMPVPVMGSRTAVPGPATGSRTPSASGSASPAPQVADVIVSVSAGSEWQRRAYLGPVPGTAISGAAFGQSVAREDRSSEGWYVWVVRQGAVAMFCSDDGGYRWTANSVVRTGDKVPVPTTYYDR